VANKNLKIGLSILIILILFSSALLYLPKFQETSFTSSTAFVGVPEFGNIICSPSSISEQEKVISVPDKNPHVYTCGAPDLPYHLPNGCDVYIKVEGSVLGFYKLTKIDPLGNRQQIITPNLQTGQDFFVTKIVQGSKIEADVTGLFYDPGDLTLRIRGTPYSLKSVESGFLRETANCDVKSLGSNYHPIKQIPETTLRPGQIVNYVLFSKVVVGDSVLNLIMLDGKEVYVYKPGAYYEVRITADGFKYVDASRSFSDDRLQCSPSNTLICTSDAKLKVSLEGKSCGFAGSGLPEGYVPVTGTDKACVFECQDSKIVNTGECKVIPKQCPPDMPVYDSETVSCVAGSAGDVECSFGEELVEKESKTCSGRLLCEIGITSEDIVTTRMCVPKTSFLTYLPLIFLGIAVIVVVLLIPKKRGKAKR